jgi:hypothetical protein
MLLQGNQPFSLFPNALLVLPGAGLPFCFNSTGTVHAGEPTVHAMNIQALMCDQQPVHAIVRVPGTG